MSTQPIVIVGTGLAGYALARELRKRDREVPLRILSADDGASYYKPKLSSAFTDKKTADQLVMATAERMAAQLNARIEPQVRVTTIDTDARIMHCGDRHIEYRDLVLAVGADPIAIPLQGDAASEVFSVNDLEDYRRLRAALAGASRIAIMGAGLIGCEFANDLRNGGIEVRVIDPAPAPLGRLLPPIAAAALRGALADIGVEWHFQTTVARVDRGNPALRLTLSDGSTHDADVILSAVGLRPRVALATAAGLAVNRGVRVDRHLRASAPGVHALGDCAEVEGLVLPFVAPILQAAPALAANLTGTPTAVAYPAMPVVVKTTRYPVVVCPPPHGVEGNWDENAIEGGVRALFHDGNGALAGFALTGTAVTAKAELAQRIPPWL